MVTASATSPAYATRWIVRGAFAGCMLLDYVAFRTGMASDSLMCRALVNNVFLAFVPVELSLHIAASRRPVVLWLLFAAWLLFFPNALYVLTDYFHLAEVNPYVVMDSGRHVRILRPDLRIWLTFTVLSVTALVSVLFGIWSLDRVVEAVMTRFRRTSAACRVSLVVAFAALASAGIYLGRFPRLHSIHLLTRPLVALERMEEACGPKMLAFVAMLTLVQIVIWGCLLFLRRDMNGRR